MVVRNELLVLNSVCQTKDIQAIMSRNMDGMFQLYPDAWDFIKDYYSKYQTVPDSSIVASKVVGFEEVPTKGETEFLVDALREEWSTTRLEDLTLKLKQNVGKMASQEILANIIPAFMKLQNVAVESQDLDITETDLALEDYQRTRSLAEQNGGVPGIPTGIDFIDSAYTTGLAGGDLIVVLGWTGRAKSLLTTKICVNAHAAGKKPMIISLEMNTKKVRDRAYTMMGNGIFRNSDLANGDIDEDNFRAWGKKMKKNAFQVISHDGNDEITPAVVQSKIDQYKPDIIVLDYAQLLSDNANTSDMTARMRNMSKEYKRLAQANNIPIILISSATPDSTASINTPPIIEQVAWSKQLSYDADLAFAVHRHDGELSEPGWVIIEIAGRKNRNGDLFSGFFKANINEGRYEEYFTLEAACGVAQ